MIIYSALFANKALAVEPEILLEQKDVVWGFDFLSPEKIVFTERRGKVFVFDLKTKNLQEIVGVPAVKAEEQGGLLDVRVHPKRENQIYLTYADPEGLSDGKSVTSVATAQVEEGKLTHFKKIFSTDTPSEIPAHYGSRIEFDGKGHIFVSLGERYKLRNQAQNLENHLGKLVRLNEDGSAPGDNPFAKNKKAKKEIWSYGHRNSQGLVYDSKKNILWQAEFGPQGGDEVNIIKPGRNYGWPMITYGREYDGAERVAGPPLGDLTRKKGMEQPFVYYVPSISPSAIALFKGDLYLAALSDQHIRRIYLKNGKAIKQKEYFKDKKWRFRCVRSFGEWLYFSTDEGRIGRFKPD